MAIHSEFIGENLHEAFHYVQESDPGSVGAGKYWLKVSTGALKRRNAGNAAWGAVGSTATTFLGLTDAPSSYSGQTHKQLRVNAGETAIEFFTPSGSGVSFVTPPVYSNSSGNADEMAYDATNLYVCIATNSWKRLPFSSVPTLHTCTYSSDGDTNGAVYFAGTNFGLISFTNPHTAGYLTVGSNGDNTGGDNKATIVDRLASNYSTSTLLGGGYVQIDLGASRGLILNKYSFRFRNDTATFCPTGWVLAGSNDGTTFTTVNTQTGLTPSISAYVSPTVAGQTVAYRYWRITMSGNNNNGTTQLALGELELYGAFGF